MRAYILGRRVALAATVGACGGGDNSSSPIEPPASGSGALRVVTVTQGTRVDADGFTVTLPGGRSRAIGVNDSVTFEDLPVGTYVVELQSVAWNCDREDGAPLKTSAVVSAGGTARVSFPVLCGPVVVLDEAHNNYHTLSGRYRPFGEFLRGNGFVARTSSAALTAAALAGVDVLVISNALNVQNVTIWSLPTPSAFTTEEIAGVKTWVEGGGALFLIADHMPFPGAAEELAAAFGVKFRNGFAFDTRQLQSPKPCLREPEIQIFRRSDGSLRAHPLTNGRNASERVDSVATFTGQAFEPTASSEPLLVFGSTAVQLFPTTAWEFSASTPVGVDGWPQASVREMGSGRAAFFGEAAMFSAQTCFGGAGLGAVPMGMNSPLAEQNGQLLLNVLRWLMRELG
jgi:hypothetical protein